MQWGQHLEAARSGKHYMHVDQKNHEKIGKKALTKVDCSGIISKLPDARRLKRAKQEIFLAEMQGAALRAVNRKIKFLQKSTWQTAADLIKWSSCLARGPASRTLKIEQYWNLWNLKRVGKTRKTIPRRWLKNKELAKARADFFDQQGKSRCGILCGFPRALTKLGRKYAEEFARATFETGAKQVIQRTQAIVSEEIQRFKHWIKWLNTIL